MIEWESWQTRLVRLWLLCTPSFSCVVLLGQRRHGNALDRVRLLGRSQQRFRGNAFGSARFSGILSLVLFGLARPRR